MDRLIYNEKWKKNHPSFFPATLDKVFEPVHEDEASIVALSEEFGRFVDFQNGADRPIVSPLVLTLAALAAGILLN